jgi:multiple sugar transport system substrate-binding protein
MLKVVSFLIVLFLFFNSCGNQNNNYVQISFWGLGAEGETVQKLMPEFEKENPRIKVKVQMIPWTAAQEKLISSYASDNTPDACQLGNTWIPQFAQLNAIENLTPWINQSNTVNKNDYFEGIWDTNIIDSLVYGLPWYIDTRVLFYRPDILKNAGYNNPPKTWQQLYEVSEKIVKQKEAKYAIFLPTNEWATPVIFGLQNGAKLLKDHNSYGNFSDEKFKDPFKFLMRFYREGLSPTGIQEVPNVYQAFAKKYIAMYISGPWNVPEFKKWMTGGLSDKWMTAPLPSPSDSMAGVSLAGGSSLVMFKRSEHKKEVWKLFEFLSEPEVQVKFYKLLNDLPAVKKAWSDSSLKNDPHMKAFYKQFQHVVAAPKIPEWEQIVFSKLQQYLEFSARGAISVNTALADLDKDVDKILEKRRWMLSRR